MLHQKIEYMFNKKIAISRSSFTELKARCVVFDNTKMHHCT